MIFKCFYLFNTIRPFNHFFLRQVDGQWKTFGWAGLTESIKTRLADLRMKAYNSMGLGEDGKKVVKKYTGGPRASLPVRAAWTSVGFIGLVTRRIGKLSILKFS